MLFITSWSHVSVFWNDSVYCCWFLHKYVFPCVMHIREVPDISRLVCFEGNISDACTQCSSSLLPRCVEGRRKSGEVKAAATLVLWRNALLPGWWINSILPISRVCEGLCTQCTQLVWKRKCWAKVMNLSLFHAREQTELMQLEILQKHFMYAGEHSNI